MELKALHEQTARSALQDDESAVLEMVALGAPLPRVLSQVCTLIEKHSPELRCSVLLLEQDRILRHGAAPSLPAEYCDAVDGIEVGPAVGSCGTAVHRGEPVMTADISTDPLWENYRDLALPHGLRACWSTPIRASDGGVLGTFAMYYDEPRYPDDDSVKFVEDIGRLVGVTVERTRSIRQFNELEQRYRTVVRSSDRVIVGFNFDYSILEWNETAERLFGAGRENALGTNYLDRFVGEDHRDRVRSALSRVTPSQPAQDIEFPVRSAEGGDIVVRWHVSRLVSPTGEPAEFMAIGRVDLGQTAVPTKAGATKRRPRKRTATARLTPRELETLTHIARGLPKRQVAVLMNVSVKTVEKHAENMMRKLDIHDRVTLTRFAIKQGLVEL